MFRFAIVAGMLIALHPVPASAQDDRLGRNRERLLRMTAEDFAQSITIDDDDLDLFATIDTSEGFQSRGGFFSRERTDNFLRAIVNKQTGEASYVLYQTITYSAARNGWRHYEWANFQSPEGLSTAALNSVTRDVVSCLSADLCAYREDFVLPLSEELVRWIATRQIDALWRFKFIGSGGEDWEDQLAPAEAAGLVQAVDNYRADHPVR